MQIWTRVYVEVQTQTWATRLVADVRGKALATLLFGLFLCQRCDGEHPIQIAPSRWGVTRVVEVPPAAGELAAMSTR